MESYRLASNLSLIDIAPPLPGFDKFIGIFVLEADQVALVDVGPSVSVDNLIAGLRELDIDPADISYIFTTHVHIDHAGGIGKAIKQIPNAKVIVHERGGPHLADPARLWEDSQQALEKYALKYQRIEPVPEDRIITVREGMSFNLGGMEIEVFETPGHASHHLSFFEKKEKRLFAGEAAGIYVGEVDLIRPATPPPFNLEMSINSLDKLISINPQSLCYGHFGCADKPLDKMCNYRKQLILWSHIITECMERKVDPQDMYEEIYKKDVVLARIDDLSQDKRDRELYFLSKGIAGYISYFQKNGSVYSKQL